MPSDTPQQQRVDRQGAEVENADPVPVAIGVGLANNVGRPRQKRNSDKPCRVENEEATVVGIALT